MTFFVPELDLYIVICTVCACLHVFYLLINSAYLMGMIGALWAICPVLLPPVGTTEQPPGVLECARAWWKRDGCSDPLVCVCLHKRETESLKVGDGEETEEAERR